MDTKFLLLPSSTTHELKMRACFEHSTSVPLRTFIILIICIIFLLLRRLKRRKGSGVIAADVGRWMSEVNFPKRISFFITTFPSHIRYQNAREGWRKKAILNTEGSLATIYQEINFPLQLLPIWNFHENDVSEIESEKGGLQHEKLKGILFHCQVPENYANINLSFISDPFELHISFQALSCWTLNNKKVTNNRLLLLMWETMSRCCTNRK